MKTKQETYASGSDLQKTSKSRTRPSIAAGSECSQIYEYCGRPGVINARYMYYASISSDCASLQTKKKLSVLGPIKMLRSGSKLLLGSAQNVPGAFAPGLPFFCRRRIRLRTGCTPTVSFLVLPLLTPQIKGFTSPCTESRAYFNELPVLRVHPSHALPQPKTIQRS